MSLSPHPPISCVSRGIIYNEIKRNTYTHTHFLSPTLVCLWLSGLRLGCVSKTPHLSSSPRPHFHLAQHHCNVSDPGAWCVDKLVSAVSPARLPPPLAEDHRSKGLPVPLLLQGSGVACGSTPLKRSCPSWHAPWR